MDDRGRAMQVWSMCGAGARVAPTSVIEGVNVPAKGSAVPSAGNDPYSGLGGAGAGRSLSIRDVEPEVLINAIDRVIQRGDAFLLSRTADGGAISVRVLADKIVHKWYPAGLDELLQLLRGLAETVE